MPGGVFGGEHPTTETSLSDGMQLIKSAVEEGIDLAQLPLDMVVKSCAEVTKVCLAAFEIFILTFRLLHMNMGQSALVIN